MASFSLILGVISALTAVAGGLPDVASSRPPLGVLLHDGATLEGNMLSFPSDWRGAAEDLLLLRDLPGDIDVYMRWPDSLADEDLRFLDGARLRGLWLRLKSTDGTLAPLRMCERVEAIILQPPSLPANEAPTVERMLAGMKNVPGLRSLRLNMKVDLDAIERLADLTELEELEIHGSGITDLGLVRLAGCVRLKSLTLSGRGQWSASGLALLKDLPSLESLRCISWADDETLAALSHVANLKALVISYSRITDEELKHLAALSNLESLILTSNKFTDDGLRHLSRLSKLKALDLSYTKLTGDGLRHLAGLANLKSLNLHDTEVSDDGLAHLAGLVNLESLVLSNTEVTDAGLKHLGRLTKLRELDLRSTETTDAGLGYLVDLVNLQSLDLSRTKVSDLATSQTTDGGPYFFDRLTSLKVLRLRGSKVTDAGVERLANLTSLETLDLSRTKATDASLGHLRRLSNLRSLKLSDTTLTDAGVRCLVNLVDLDLIDALSASPTGSGTPPPTLANLESLSLRRTNVKGTGMQNLARLRKLTSLEVSGNELTNEAVERIAKLEGLETLMVGGPRVTEDGLAHLSRLPNLRELMTALGTQGVDAGIKAILANRDKANQDDGRIDLRIRIETPEAPEHFRGTLEAMVGDDSWLDLGSFAPSDQRKGARAALQRKRERQ